jgi:hypothetical protein
MPAIIKTIASSPLVLHFTTIHKLQSSAPDTPLKHSTHLDRERHSRTKGTQQTELGQTPQHP